jgi:quercetin dioxygenase-like cupin family protein
MSGRGHVFELADEVRSLRGELDHTSGGRAAKTLAKTDGLRVTLVLLSSGTTLNPESTAGGASLHVLEGRLRVQAEGEHWDLGPRELIVLGENLRDPVTAIEETAFLVTVAWPAGAGASEHTGAEGSP